MCNMCVHVYVYVRILHPYFIIVKVNASTIFLGITLDAKSEL